MFKNVEIWKSSFERETKLAAGKVSAGEAAGLPLAVPDDASALC